MIVENTELEFDEVDEICLDRYLGTHNENKFMWAQRVWNNCKLHSEGTFISSVYNSTDGQDWKERAQEIWANKKERRKGAICKEFGLDRFNNDSILSLKTSQDFKTRDQMHAEEQTI